jgi:hypothetical protein
MQEAIDTCHRCGLNVPRSTTVYSNSGDLQCRNCADSADFQRSIARAQASANQSYGGGVIGAVRTMQAQAELDRAGGVEGIAAGSAGLFQVMRKAGAETFTCRCAKTFPVEQGAYSPGGRVLCAPCLAADTSRAPAGPSNTGRIVGTVIAVIVVAIYLYFRFGLR